MNEIEKKNIRRLEELVNEVSGVGGTITFEDFEVVLAAIDNLIRTQYALLKLRNLFSAVSKDLMAEITMVNNACANFLDTFNSKEEI